MEACDVCVNNELNDWEAYNGFWVKQGLTQFYVQCTQYWLVVEVVWALKLSDLHPQDDFICKVSNLGVVTLGKVLTNHYARSNG